MPRPRLITLALTLWILIFAASFALPFVLEPTGDGFTRGLNRIAALFLWQGIAFAIAVVVWILGLGIERDRTGMRWASRVPAIVHVVSVLLVVGLVLWLRFSGPAIDSGIAPGPVTAPAVPVAEPAEPARDIQRFTGIFRGGFETSHFYTMDGEGPFWLEANGAERERIYASYEEGPGRSGAVRVALTVDAWLEETDGELEYLGIDGYRLNVVSVEAVRALSESEFDLVLGSIVER